MNCINDNQLIRISDKEKIMIHIYVLNLWSPFLKTMNTVNLFCKKFPFTSYNLHLFTCELF